MDEDRLRILDRRDQVHLDDLFHQRSLEDVILELHKLHKNYEAEVFSHDKHIEFEVDHYGYDGGVELYVRVSRWETDGEYSNRLAREEKLRETARKAKETKKAKALAQALTTEQEERELLAKLQAKYGDKP